MEKKIEGIVPPLVTPFKKNGEIDWPRVRQEIKFLISCGVDAISPGGSTGEGAALDDDELVALVKEIRSISSTIPIVCGVIRNSTKAAVRAGKAVEAAGASALMVTPVSYNVLVPDDEGNYNFYKTISDNVSLPIIIYNVVPQNTIKADLFDRLLDIKNVYGIKQSCGSIPAFYDMMVKCGTKGKIFSATDEMIASTFELGAHGAISAILSVFPKESVKMWKLVKEGNVKKALEMQKQLYPVWMAIAGNQFPIRVKYAIKLLGRDLGYTRSPICHMSKAEMAKISQALKDSKLI